MDLAFERRAWTLIYLCLGVIEGGTAAVMVRALFGGAVAGIIVDLVLAVVSAAPAWANLASLVYARRAQGRPKVQQKRKSTRFRQKTGSTTGTPIPGARPY